jgi:hypothetical protein
MHPSNNSSGQSKHARRSRLGAVLHLDVRLRDKSVRVTVRSDATRRRRYSASSGLVARYSAAMRTALEDPSANPRSLLIPNTQLSRLLLEPIQDLLDMSSALELALDAELLQLPFELLVYRRQPVCLRMPVTCAYACASDSPFRLQWPASACILSDRGPDPDRACLAVASLFNIVSYHDDPNSAPAVLRTQGPKDVIVFSLHGDVGAAVGDYMQLGRRRLTPRDLTRLRPRLAYFDSCRLATSWQFLSALRGLGTEYWLAPFIKNEAGDSSTSTMKQFFSLLLGGDSPEVAMFKTRRSLWKLYSEYRRPQRVFRALPFRVYRLSPGGRPRSAT